MSDKRQRARIQGSWAKPLPKSSTQTVGVLNNQPKHANTTTSGQWGFGNEKTSKTFEFHQPAKPVKEVPPERVIEHLGDYEISPGPSGVSRLRLRPGFLTPEEADWMFSKLLAELPWSQKTNYRLGFPYHDGAITVSPCGDGALRLVATWLKFSHLSICSSSRDAMGYLAVYLMNAPLARPVISGEAYEEPRLSCWYGELSYTFARSTMAANTQWHPLLVTLRETVEQASGCTFNSLLCNLYRDGHDSIGWHSDDEASLGPKPTVVSLSLGDTRVFSLRKKPPAEDNGDYTYVERIRIPLSHGALLLMEGATQDDWQHQVAKEYHDRGPRINLTFRTIHPEPEGHRAGTKMRFAAKQL